MKKLIPALILSITSLPLMAGTFNLIEPNINWSKPEVRVCFADYSQLKNTTFSTTRYKVTENSFSVFSDEQKLTIKEILTKEYTPETTGIYYVGWEDCQKDPHSDLYLFHMQDKAHDFIGTASMGDAGVLTFVDGRSSTRLNIMQKRKGSKKGYVVLNTASIEKRALSLNEQLQLVSVHEFGHVAGLRHEHADKEIKTNKRFSDLNCATIKFKYSEDLFDSTEKTAVYDRNSIMNYCYMDALLRIGLDYTQKTDTPKKYDLIDESVITKETTPEGINHKIRIGLSQGDIHALRCLYKYDKKTKKAICRDDYDPKSPK